MAGLLLLIALTVLEGTTAVAGPEFHPSSVEKGVFWWRVRH